VSDGTPFSAVLRRPRRSLLPWLAALWVSTLPCPHPAPTQDASSSHALSSSLRGTVINSVTREPIARALVFSPDNRFATFTNDQGHFEFQLPRIESNPNSPTGGPAFYSSSVQLMARKPGFLDPASWQAYNPQNAATDDTMIALIPEALIVRRVNLPSSNQSDRITVQVYKRQVRDGRPFWAPAASATTRLTASFASPISRQAPTKSLPMNCSTAIPLLRSGRPALRISAPLLPRGRRFCFCLDHHS
jgi:hypothetical protein